MFPMAVVRRRSITEDDSGAERYDNCKFGNDKWQWWRWLMVAGMSMMREPTMAREHFEHREKEGDCGFPDGHDRRVG